MGLTLFHVCDHINQNVITLKCHKNAFFSLLYFPIRCHFGCRQHRTLQIAAYVFALIWGFTCKHSLSLGSWHLSDSQLLCFISPARGRPSTFRSPLLTFLLWTVLLHETKVLLCCCPLSCSAREQQGFRNLQWLSNIGAGAAAVEELHRITCS